MIRSLAGLSLLVVFAGYSSVNLFVSEYRAFQGQPVPDHSRADSITAYVSRFDRLKAMLPPDAVVQLVNRVGEDRKRSWFLAQYALAPILLDSAQHDLVIGNFPEGDSVAIARLAQAETLTTLADFDNGVVLFQRRKRR